MSKRDVCVQIFQAELRSIRALVTIKIEDLSVGDMQRE